MKHLRLVAPPLLASLLVIVLGASGALADTVTGGASPTSGGGTSSSGGAPAASGGGGSSGAPALSAGTIAGISNQFGASPINAVITPLNILQNQIGGGGLGQIGNNLGLMGNNLGQMGGFIFFGYAEPRDSFAAFNKIPPANPPFVPSWRIWAMGFGGSQTTNAGSGINTNTASQLYGSMIGADYSFSPDTLVGFALTGGGSNFSVANTRGGSSDLFQASLYARQNFGATYLTGILSYGWQDIRNNRNSLGDSLSAEFNTNAYTARIEAGHRYAVDGYGLTPYGAVQETALELPAYSETPATSALALNYKGQSEVYTRSELGLRSDKSFLVTNSAIVTLSGRAAWAHDYNTNSTAEGTFASLPGSTFVINGAMLASDSALITASAKTSFRNGWSAELSYEGEFSNITTSNGGRGTLSYHW